MNVMSRGGRLAEIAVVFAAAIGVVVAGSGLAAGSYWGAVAVVLVANALMVSLVWAGARARGQRLEHFGLTLRWSGLRSVLRSAWQSLLVCAVAIGAFVAGAVVAATLVGLPAPADMSKYSPMAGHLPLLLASLPVVWVFSSFGEELIYRGFLITRIEELGAGGRSRRWVAVGVSAAIFGLAHYAWGVTGMIQAGFMGLALGFAYLAVRRRLWVVVLAHGYMDTLLLVQMYARPPA